MSILLDLARRAVTAAAQAIGVRIAEKLLPAEQESQPLPARNIESKRQQIEAATSHKVKPSGPL